MSRDAGQLSEAVMATVVRGEVSDREFLQMLKSRAGLADETWRLVSKVRCRHSEILEFEGISGRDRARWIVKRITEYRSPQEAEESVKREFNALQTVRSRLSPALAETLPAPLSVLPDVKALVLGKLSGDNLAERLKREANRLVGFLFRHTARELGKIVGEWLREFHDQTQGDPIAHDTDVFIAKLDKWLIKCSAGGLNAQSARRIRDAAVSASKQFEGLAVPTAARQGDFVPQNILISGSRIGVVDFENFSECDVVLEDVAYFVAYLAMLELTPFYSGAALKAVAEGFMQAYRFTIPQRLFHLYLVKAALTSFSEFPNQKGFARILRDRELVGRKLALLALGFLQGA